MVPTILSVLAYQTPNRAAGNMSTLQSGTRFFDLNIDKFLEHWGPAEAVREIIANAVDEQALTNTRDIEIHREAQGVWIVRDYGRGLAPEHLTQNESAEKKRAAVAKQLLGRFGVGLK